MDHGTRDKSARLILASVPVQALLMAGVLVLALGGRSAAPAPDGAYFVKPAPAQGPALCKVMLHSTRAQVGPDGTAVRVWWVPGADGSGSPADGKALPIRAAACPAAVSPGGYGPVLPGLAKVPPAPPAKP